MLIVDVASLLFVFFGSENSFARRVDHALNCIKGGGACHLREKVLAEAAKTSVHFSKSSNWIIPQIFPGLYSLQIIEKMCSIWEQT